MNLIRCIKDEKLLYHYFADKNTGLDTWQNWFQIIRAIYGLPIKSSAGRDLIHQATGGRDARKLPSDGFRTILLLAGRRSGKTKVTSSLGAFEARFAGREKHLSAGEFGCVPIICPTKKQGRLIREYTRAIFSTPILAKELVQEDKEGFHLKSNVRIEIQAGSFKGTRGYTNLAVLIDEICFFQYEEEAKMTDIELVRSLRPSLLTTGGPLICIGSCYAEKGWAFEQWKKHWGNDKSNVFVVKCPSQLLNPRLNQQIIDDALAEDLASARSEYFSEWRSDLLVFVPRELVESLVVPGRYELMPDDKLRYVAFCDPSGGRGDDATLAIAHREGRMTVLDALKVYNAPFSPHQVIGEMVQVLRKYNVRRITGDNYAAEFVSEAFKAHGVHYEKAEKPKSALYLELLPRLCSKEIEILDNKVLIDQLCSLERRTRSGGRDTIDHPSGIGHHDDLANSLAGVCEVAGVKRLKAGGFG